MSGAPERRVHRVDWLPGADVLEARCHCGARSTQPDPVAVWDWLLDHPRHAAPAPDGGRP
ncbi:hypothetical protein [Kitasatospora sp. NPDC057198]|uniref:hypothetical protein n=1 Tax=Kitasatospora sp. NPDC057198 TaxID=3346046 RepID=UPI00363789A0